MANLKNFFNEEEKNKIINAIQTAEQETSGEIRIHLEKFCFVNPYKRAIKIFEKIGMQNTKDRNGVLILLAVKSKKFAIIGDLGINSKVPKNFWESTTSKMKEFFAQNKFSEGIIYAILEIGKKLKEYFPYKSDDKNELSDEISIG